MLLKELSEKNLMDIDSYFYKWLLYQMGGAYHFQSNHYDGGHGFSQFEHHLSIWYPKKYPHI